MSMQCHVCHVAVNSSAQFRQHMLGQSHARKLHRLMESQENASSTSSPLLAQGYHSQSQPGSQDPPHPQAYGQAPDQAASHLGDYYYGQGHDPWQAQVGQAVDDSHVFGRGSGRNTFEQEDRGGGGGAMDMEWEGGGGGGSGAAVGGGRGMRAIRGMGREREAEYLAAVPHAVQKSNSGQRLAQGFLASGPVLDASGNVSGGSSYRAPAPRRPFHSNKADAVPAARSFPAQAVYVEAAITMPSAVGLTASELQRAGVRGYVIRGTAPVLAPGYQTHDALTLDHAAATSWPFREDSPPFIDENRQSFRDDARDGSQMYRDSRQPFSSGDNRQPFRDGRQPFSRDNAQPFKDDSSQFRDSSLQFGNNRRTGKKGGQKFASSGGGGSGSQQFGNNRSENSQQPFGNSHGLMMAGSTGTGSQTERSVSYNNNMFKGIDSSRNSSGVVGGSNNMSTSSRQTQNTQQQQKPVAKFTHHPSSQPPPPQAPPPPAPSKPAEDAQVLVLGDHMGVVSVDLKSQDQLRCQLCVVSFTSQRHAQEHYCSAKHARKARIARLKELGALTDDNQNKSAKEFYCSDCNITVNAQDQLTVHQEGARHKKMVEQRKRKAGSQMDAEPVEKTTQGPR